MKKNPFLSTIWYLLLIIGIGFLNKETIHLSKKNQALKTELSELHDVKYGLMSVHAWKRQVDDILVKKIDEFQLSADDLETFRAKLEEGLFFLINEAERILITERANSSYFSDILGAYFVQWAADFDNIRQQIPTLSVRAMNLLEVDENIDQIKDILKIQIRELFKETLGKEDRSNLIAIGEKYACDKVYICSQKIESEIDKNQQSIFLYIGFLLVLTILLSILVKTRGGRFIKNSLLFSLVGLLIVGISLPMLDLDARISDFTLSFMGEQIRFKNQVLFFQSKSILDVFVLLFNSEQFQSKLIGILILLFSVIFPFGKIIASLFAINARSTFNRSPFLKFLCFKTGKWTMADVLVVAIIITFLSLRSVINSQLSRLGNSIERVDLLTTNETSLQIGFLIFTAFAVIGIYFSEQLQKED